MRERFSRWLVQLHVAHTEDCTNWYHIEKGGLQVFYLEVPHFRVDVRRIFSKTLNPVKVQISPKIHIGCAGGARYRCATVKSSPPYYVYYVYKSSL